MSSFSFSVYLFSFSRKQALGSSNECFHFLSAACAMERRMPFFSLLVFLMATTSSSFAEERKTYIVHMDQTKVAALDLSLAGTKRWYESVLETVMEYSSQEEEEDGEVNREKDAPRVLYVYETAISGFAARLSTKQAESLRNVDGFLYAHEDEMLALQTTHSPQFLGLHMGKGLWKPPTSASDVIIGVIDSGITPEHVSFSDKNLPPVPARWKGACEGGTQFSHSNCNRKLIGARAFFRGYEAVAGPINDTVDYRSARDAQGHGTHTASTAAGNVVAGASILGIAKGTAGGMSFASRIAAYKACWPGGCPSSDVLAAIDNAVADGVDVLSLSLGGGGRPYYMDSTAIGAFGAVQKGVLVSCSAGNSGPSQSTLSNTAPWIMTVAASHLDRSFPATIKLGNGRVFNGASLYSGEHMKPLPLVYGDTAGEQGAEYCIDGSLSPALVRGKIVVCDRGMSGRTAKGLEVNKSGGAAMLLLNNENQGEDLFADAHVLPGTSVGATAAGAIKDYVVTAKRPTATITFKGTKYGYRAPIMAAFSSRGPSSVGGDIVKPDVTAPGVNILAAWPLTKSPSGLVNDKRRVSFNILSGTSMSCPHVSGLAALIKSVHCDWSPAAVKSALMTTAYTVDNRNAPIGDAGSSESATPFAFGSGHVDPERAVDPGLIYDISTEDYLEYLCSLRYTPHQVAILAKKNYSCPRGRALETGDLNYPSFGVSFASGGTRNATVIHRRTVTNVGAPRSRYTVRVSEPNGVGVSVEPRVLAFTEVGEKLSYKVSFVASGPKRESGSYEFGSIVWVYGGYSVRSPIAVTWK